MTTLNKLKCKRNTLNVKEISMLKLIREKEYLNII